MQERIALLQSEKVVLEESARLAHHRHAETHDRLESELSRQRQVSEDSASKYKCKLAEVVDRLNETKSAHRTVKAALAASENKVATLSQAFEQTASERSKLKIALEAASKMVREQQGRIHQLVDAASRTQVAENNIEAERGKWRAVEIENEKLAAHCKVQEESHREITRQLEESQQLLQQMTEQRQLAIQERDAARLSLTDTKRLLDGQLQELKMATDEVAALQGKVKTLTLENENVKASARVKSAMVDDKEDTIQNLRREIEQLTTTILMNRKETTELAEQLADSSGIDAAEHDALLDRIDAFASIRSELEAIIDEQAAELDQLDIRGLREELLRKDEAIHNVDQELKSMRATFAALQKSESASAETNKELRARSEALAESKSQLESVVQNMQRQIDEIQLEKANAMSREHAAKSENEDLVRELRHLQESLTKAETMRDQHSHRSSQLAAELATEQRKIASLTRRAREAGSILQQLSSNTGASLPLS